jgi:hypothetical protein
MLTAAVVLDPPLHATATATRPPATPPCPWSAAAPKKRWRNGGNEERVQVGPADLRSPKRMSPTTTARKPRGPAQLTSWMRIRLPAGSRTAQSRTPYGCSVGSWTTSPTLLACNRSNAPSRSLVASRMPA